MSKNPKAARRRAALLGVVASTVVSLQCYAQSAPQIGVGVHMGNYPLGATESTVDALGLDFRGDVPWKDIEITQGNLQYPTANSPLRNLDLLVTDAANRQRNPLLILAYGNRLYDGGGQISSPAGLAAFSKYVAFAVNHFKGRVNEFEIWNEWNHGLGAAPGQKEVGDPAQYVQLLRASYERIKAENPNARVIGGAVSGTDTSWTEKFAAGQGLKYLDGFSVHPYVQCNARAPKAPDELKLSSLVWKSSSPGGATRLSFGSSTFSPIGGTPEQAIAWLDQVRAILDKYSPTRQIPVYVSEIGWPTSVGACGVSEQTAAAYLQRFMLLAAARPWIAGVWWYDLFDDGADATNREFRFGLERQDYKTPKPGYESLSAIRDLLKSPRDVTSTIGEDGAIEIKGIASNNKAFYAAWLPTDQFETTQKWGKVTELANSGFRQATGSGTVASPTISATPMIMIQQ